MKQIYSHYKIFGGFGLLLAFNIFFAFLVYKGLIVGREIRLFDTATWLHNSNNKLVLFLLGIQLFWLLLFVTQCKFIIVNNHTITFVNPLLPFIRFRKKGTSYDYYLTIEEYSRGGTHEAVWLIKNGKVKSRISSFYYSNYQDLKDSLCLRDSGTLNANAFSQLFYLLGMRVK